MRRTMVALVRLPIGCCRPGAPAGFHRIFMVIGWDPATPPAPARA